MSQALLEATGQVAAAGQEEPTPQEPAGGDEDLVETEGGEEATKFQELEMLEVFVLRNGNKAVKVGKTSYIRMTPQGHACKLRIKNSKAVSKLPTHEAVAFKRALTG